MKTLQELGIQRNETITVQMAGYPVVTGKVFGRGLTGFTLILEGNKPVVFECEKTTLISR